jgi:hypothetical protein
MNIISASTASVERSFSYMNLIKTHLSSRLTQRNLEALMRISMEGRDKLLKTDRVFAGSFGNCHLLPKLENFIDKI